MFWECGPHARWEPNAGPEFPQHPHSKTFKGTKKIWYNFDNFEFVYEGGKAISAS